MADQKNPFWSAQDEIEYIRQEQLRGEKVRAAAFTAGFEAGAAWAISHGVREMARIFEETADFWNGFPPELVKSFAAAMTEFAPEIGEVILAETKAARERAAAAQ